MTKILIADKLSKEAEKIFLANNIPCDIKTGLSENEIVDIVGDYNYPHAHHHICDPFSYYFI